MGERGQEQWDTGSRWNSVQRIPAVWSAANKDTDIWNVKRNCVWKSGRKKIRQRSFDTEAFEGFSRKTNDDRIP